MAQAAATRHMAQLYASGAAVSIGAGVSIFLALGDKRPSPTVVLAKEMAPPPAAQQTSPTLTPEAANRLATIHSLGCLRSTPTGTSPSLPLFPPQSFSAATPEAAKRLATIHSLGCLRSTPTGATPSASLLPPKAVYPAGLDVAEGEAMTAAQAQDAFWEAALS